MVLIAMYAFSCSYLTQRLKIRDCKFSLVKVDIQKFGLTALTLRLDIKITNPNTIEVKIDKMDLDLYIEDKKTIAVTISSVAVESGQAKIVPAALQIPYSAIGMTIIDNLKGKTKINYKLMGTVTIHTPLGEVLVPATVSEN